MPEVRTWQLAAGSAAVGLALAAGAVAAAGPWDSGQRKAEKERAVAHSRAGGAHHQPSAPKGPAPAPSAPSVLAAVGAAPAGDGVDSKAAPADLSRRLGPLLEDSGLGRLRAASVVDVATGAQLYGKEADAPMVPASTVKIATSVAALTALGPDHRIPTSVVAAEDGESLTLVGGGDPTLDKARLAELADRTAAALRDRGSRVVRLTYDASLYKGPARHPIGPNDNIAPVSALMVNQGRIDGSTSGPARRSDDPAKDAAGVFAQLLAERGVAAKDAPAPGRAAAGSEPVAEVLSPPLSDLVERSLTTSDNDIAEALARHTALATDETADFTGAGKAVTRRLAALKLPLKGARFADGSGLNRADRVSAGLLTGLLARAADPARPELRPVLTGLPVAGFSGTLQNRSPKTAPGTGPVRAKTGTLSGVNTLAGTVVTPDGRLLAFAFLAGDTAAPGAAQEALDRLAAALAS
ncbi:D-alanyl-D-alanine carboxypeptidase/D-alanyl-D-alanine-endopeptidase [Streptomyces sp. NPDC051907]|uniref:D-alanyl-D-alanine carboxypeptidase/D-alanyl-D-alanine endopeptidase n=1 Tax=Streptomyces sp. NPDC051907 TaxID=3155284 RepID=UPI00342FC230